MVLLESLDLEQGQIMPEFDLQDPFGTQHSLSSLMGPKGLFIGFTCNHCPYAIAIWERLIQLESNFSKLGIATVAINPNINPNYPDDSPAAMKKKIESDNIPFPYLIDASQSVAKAYKAQCTPDLYVLKHDRSLFYHGRLDDNWQNPNEVTQHDLTDAITLLASNKAAPETQHPSMGCSIKWLNQSA